MTTVGWVGLGKLGAPCAAALAEYGGHKVVGYDVRGSDSGDYDWSDLRPVKLADSVADVVAQATNVVFVAVQTPHSVEYGGEVPTPVEPREFEYAYLVEAVRDVCAAAGAQRKYVTLVIVSTVLPGTFNRYLRPLVNEYVTPIYHPFFIAMGTVVDDFVNPEMTLFGVDVPGVEECVRELYESLHDAPAPVMSIESAELAKVAYNTYISLKIVFANAIAEMCDHTGADVDQVTDALALGSQRIVSARYMRAGMGDGGACHPRDNVALSALAQRYELSVDLMDFLGRARESQTERFAHLVDHWARLANLPVIVLGRAYKPNVAMIDGSPALLLRHYLADLTTFTQLDPVVTPSDNELLAVKLTYPHVYFIATDHDVFRGLTYPTGSVVIDPCGGVTPQLGVTLVRPGRKYSS